MGSIDAADPFSLIAEMPASVALHYAVLPLRLDNDELIVGSEDGIDPVSLAALTRKVGRKVRYVIVLWGQIVTGLRHWYARRRGHDPRAMLPMLFSISGSRNSRPVKSGGNFIAASVPVRRNTDHAHHINRSAINVLLLRHERSSLPLGKFWSPKALSARNVDRVPDTNANYKFRCNHHYSSRFKH